MLKNQSLGPDEPEDRGEGEERRWRAAFHKRARAVLVSVQPEMYQALRGIRLTLPRFWISVENE